MRLLLAEDDAMIGEAVRNGLQRQGFAVDWVTDGVATTHAIAVGEYDLLLLDLGLPRKEGLRVLQELRRGGASLPVLIVTARDAVADRVAGLDAGADDYVVKPFEITELAARIRAVLRRKGGRATGTIEHLDVTLDPATHEVRRGGRDPRGRRRSGAVRGLRRRWCGRPRNPGRGHCR